MSVVASAKVRLVGTGGVLAPLMPVGVKVFYSEPTRDTPRELLYGGDVVGTVDLKAMAAGARVKRGEELTLLLHIRVYKPNGKREDTDARAVAIADVIDQYIAANWTLDDLPELKKATVTGVELGGWTDDDGCGSTLDIAIGLTSYMT